jgi:hypothetical protein
VVEEEVFSILGEEEELTLQEEESPMVRIIQTQMQSL